VSGSPVMPATCRADSPSGDRVVAAVPCASKARTVAASPSPAAAMRGGMAEVVADGEHRAERRHNARKSARIVLRLDGDNRETRKSAVS
jgi:hypothetical protein